MAIDLAKELEGFQVKGGGIDLNKELQEFSSSPKTIKESRKGAFREAMSPEYKEEIRRDLRESPNKAMAVLRNTGKVLNSAYKSVNESISGTIGGVSDAILNNLPNSMPGMPTTYPEGNTDIVKALKEGMSGQGDTSIGDALEHRGVPAAQLLGTVGEGMADPIANATGGAILKGAGAVGRNVLARPAKAVVEKLMEFGGTNKRALAYLKERGFRNVNLNNLTEGGTRAQVVANTIVARTDVIKDKASESFKVFNKTKIDQVSPDVRNDIFERIRKAVSDEPPDSDNVQEIEVVLEKLKKITDRVDDQGVPLANRSANKGDLFQLIQDLKDFGAGGNAVAAKAVGAAAEGLKGVSKEYSKASKLWAQFSDLLRAEKKITGGRNKAPGKVLSVANTGDKIESYFELPDAPTPFSENLQSYGKTLEEASGGNYKSSDLITQVKDVASLKGQALTKPQLTQLSYAGGAMAVGHTVGVPSGVTAAVSGAMLGLGIPRSRIAIAKSLTEIVEGRAVSPMARFMSTKPEVLEALRVNAVRAGLGKAALQGVGIGE